MRLYAVIAIALSLVLLQCSGGGGAEVGAPCTPSLENDPAFTGFKITEETIETGAPECGGGVCLVNHFQGRVSCPLGQPAPGEGSDESCQMAGADGKSNAGKGCCSPDAQKPALGPVCGQCQGQNGNATRNAENAVYCTCRCGVAEGSPDEPDYDFCSCPEGFECSEIRKNLGVGEQSLTGKYCIRRDTAYDANQDQCGSVDGFWSTGSDGVKCAGVGTGQCQTGNGLCE
jgi:hypothetical protein